MSNGLGDTDVVLVQRRCLRALTLDDARTLVENLCGHPERAVRLEALARDLGITDRGSAMLDGLADALAGGELLCFESRPFVWPELAERMRGFRSDDPTLWSDIPSLSELLPAAPAPATTRPLAVELIDYTGIPFAGRELELETADGARRMITLDESGRWAMSDAPARGPATLRIPADLELAAAERRRPGPEGFAAAGSDLHAHRGPEQVVALAVGQTHRVVLDPPAAQPTFAFPAASFASDRAFPQPGIVHLLTYAQELVDRDPSSTLGVFGHTDVTGDVDANKTLSDRRAQVVYALLTGDVDPFIAVAHDESWTDATYQTMLRVLGCNPTAIDDEAGDQTLLAVRAFRAAYNANTWHREGRGRAFGDLDDADTLDASTKDALVDAYHAELSVRVAPDRFVGPRHAGCGELNPIGDDHPENRRVSLAIYGAEAPDASAFPCRAGDASACERDDGGMSRCRFYRERIHEQPVARELWPFWDFEWLRTISNKAHLSALTHLPDTNDAKFVVRRARIDPASDDSGTGSPPAHGSVVAELPGLIRNGVAYALWDFADDDPFEVERWFVAPESGVLRDYAPPYFTIEAHGMWGRSDAPSYRLREITLSQSSETPVLGMTTDGHLVLVPHAELGTAPRHLRVGAVRLQLRRTDGFQG